ncbi:MAG: hypothetical protein KBT03_04690 [Bacteroidales bacterium]|nr:hypothetical protein [Candidatus Scybalousia scybalohippi]
MSNYSYGVMPSQQLTAQQLYQLQLQQQMLQQQMQQQQMQQPMPSNPPADERIWVANEQSAENYLVAPGAFVRLWNSNENIFYEKRADAIGRPLPIECYRYEKIEPNSHEKEQKTTIDYSKEINSLNERILALEKEAKRHEQSNANNKRA